MSERSVTRKSKVLSRIPPPRVKRILQTDEEIGKMANPVPAVIARSLEVFIEKLLTKSVDVTQQRSAKTLSPQHIKECVKLVPTFAFLHGVVASVPDLGAESSTSHQSTVTSHRGSSEGYGISSHTGHRSVGNKRRGLKHASLGESSTSSQDAVPPRKLSRRGKASHRSMEFEDDDGDFSNDGDTSGDDSNDIKNTMKRPGISTAKKSSKARNDEEVYELGPTVSDDVPDDPSTE